VIGMAREIDDDDALSFAGGFYRALGYGRSVAEAFDLGRNELALSDLSAAATPHLITRRVDASAMRFIESAIPLPMTAETVDALLTSVFISYSRADKPFVDRLTNDLKENGVDVWVDTLGLKPGTRNWEQALREAIRLARSVLLVASPNSRRSVYVQDELAIAEMYNREVIPIWADGDTWMDSIAMGMGKRQFADLRGNHYAAGFAQVVEVLTGRAPLPIPEKAPPETPDFPPRNPYKGLRAFKADDQADFFGRDEVIAALTAKIEQPSTESRLVAILGASGSGKSSVAMAGLLPALQRRHPDWVFLPTIVPGIHPLDRLNTALSEAFHQTTAHIQKALDDPSTRGLHLLTTQHVGRGERRAVLLIDQFEELFTQTADERERAAFIDLITTAASEPNGALIVILTMRADFYDRPMNYPELGRLISSGASPILPMSLTDLRDIIEKPAALPDVQVTFDEGLVGELVFQLREQVGALPLLQFTLDQLFEKREDRRLTWHSYDAIGGVHGALARHAEATYMGLPTERHQALARILFLRLIEPGATEQDTTRRRAPLSELRLPDPTQSTLLAEVRDAFVENRLLTTNKHDTIETIEVSHEALIREWVRLGDWLNSAREDLRFQRGFALDVADWLRKNKPKDDLYRGVRLYEAQTWAAKAENAPSDDEIAFITASAEEAARQKKLQEGLERRARRRTRIALGIFALAVPIIAVIALVALNSARVSAENQRRSESLRLAADAILQTDIRQSETVALLSIRALKNTYSVQADAALGRALENLGTIRIFGPYRDAYAKNKAGHIQRVRAVELLKDGKTFVSGGYDNSARLWELETGRELQIYLADEAVLCVAVSPDERYIAGGTYRGTIFIWDRASGEVVRKWYGEANQILGVAFSPDGSRLLSGGADRLNLLNVWDVATGTGIRSVRGHNDYITSIHYSPDGFSILTTSADYTARLWDANTFEVIRVFSGHTLEVMAGAFSSDGRYILTGSVDNTARLWSVTQGAEVRRFVGHTDTVRAVAFSPDGRYAVTGGQDNLARLWDVTDGTLLGTLVGHGQSTDIDFTRYDYSIRVADDQPRQAGAVDAVVFHPNGTMILTGGRDGTIRLWTFLARKFIGHSDAISHVAFSPDGKYILSGGLDRTVRLWDVLSGSEVRQFAGSIFDIYHVAFAPDGKYVAAGGKDGATRIWETSTGSLLRQVPPPETWDSATSSTIWSIAFAPDGKTLLTADEEGNIIAWDVLSGARNLLYTPLDSQANLSGGSRYWNNTQIFDLNFSPNGGYVLSAANDTTARLWLPEQGKDIRWFVGETLAGVYSAAMTADHRYVATGGVDRVARLFEVGRSKMIREFRGHTDSILKVAFSPDDRFLLTTSKDGTARLWNVETGEEIRRMVGHTGAVLSAAFSPDGAYIVTAGADGLLRLWDTDYLNFVRFACRQLARDFTEGERTAYAITDSAATCPTESNPAGLPPAWTPVPTRSAPPSVPLGTLVPPALPPNTIMEYRADLIRDFSLFPDGSRLALYTNGIVKIIDSESGKELQELGTPQKGNGYYFGGAKITPDGRYALIRTDSDDIEQWDVQDRYRVRTFATKRYPGFETYLLPSAVGKTPYFAVSTWETCVVIDLTTGARVLETEAGSPCVFSPDGTRIVDNSYTIYNVVTGQKELVLRGVPMRNRAPLMLDNNTALIAYTTQANGVALSLWNSDTGKVQAVLAHPITPPAGQYTQAILSYRIMPDGRYMLTSAIDNALRLWDMQDGTLLRTIRLETGVSPEPYPPTILAIAPDGESAFIQIGGLGIIRRVRLTAAP